VLVAELPRPEAEVLVGVLDSNHRVVDAPLLAVVALDEFDLVAVRVLTNAYEPPQESGSR